MRRRRARLRSRIRGWAAAGGAAGEGSDALEEFRAAFAVNLEDITHIEVMKMQQGKATADVRIVLAESAAQETSIDNQEKILGELLNKFKRAGPRLHRQYWRGGGAQAGEGALSMKILHAGEDAPASLQRANFLHVLQATAVPTSCAPIMQDPPRASRGRVPDGSKGRCGQPAADMSELVKKAREKHEAEMIRFVEEYHAGTRGERPVTRALVHPRQC